MPDAVISRNLYILAGNTEGREILSNIGDSPMQIIKGILTAATIASAGSALSQPVCAPRETVELNLSTKYGERRVMIALTLNGMVTEVWANEETGTCTITQTDPTGLTCLVVACEGVEFTVDDQLNFDPDA